MECPLAQSTWYSNSGGWSSKWIIFKYNEEVLAIDFVFEHADSEAEIWTSTDSVVTQIPHAYCSRFAVLKFISALQKWSTMPIQELRLYRFSGEFNLCATSYNFGESTLVSVREPAIQRSSPDHRWMEFTWERGSTEIRHGFMIDVSSTLLFIEPFLPLLESRKVD